MYQLFLVTPEAVIFNDLVYSTTIPGTIGYLEILKNHAPIISSLTAGKLTFIDKNKKTWIWALAGGLLEVAQNKATVLADAIELASEIDITKAEEAVKNAQRILEAPESETDLLHAKRILLRAQNRIKIAKEFKAK